MPCFPEVAFLISGWSGIALLEHSICSPFIRQSAQGADCYSRRIERICVLIHLPTQLVTNWIVNKPFTL